MIRHIAMDAFARLRGGDAAPNLSGVVRFYGRRDGVLVEADISGLPPSETGFYGFHIHEGTDCGGEDFSDTGGHFNPGNTLHPNHAGDLPPLLGNQGRAYMLVLTDRFRVSDILGKTVVIHGDPDDFHTQPAGNSGMKIACGVIQQA